MTARKRLRAADERQQRRRRAASNHLCTRSAPARADPRSAALGGAGWAGPPGPQVRRTGGRRLGGPSRIPDLSHWGTSAGRALSAIGTAAARDARWRLLNKCAALSPARHDHTPAKHYHGRRHGAPVEPPRRHRLATGRSAGPRLVTADSSACRICTCSQFLLPSAVRSLPVVSGGRPRLL